MELVKTMAHVLVHVITATEMFASMETFVAILAHQAAYKILSIVIQCGQALGVVGTQHAILTL